MNLHDWIDELCDVLDVETEVDEALMQDLAEVAEKNVGVHAGPVTTYLLGFAAAAHEAQPDKVEGLAGSATLLAEHWDQPAGAPDPDDFDDPVPDDSDIDHTGDTFEE